MSVLGLTIVFQPPPWPTALLAAAAAALLLELGLLLRAIWSRNGPATAMGMTCAALLAGPVVALAAWALDSIAAIGGHRAGARDLLKFCLRGTMIAALAGTAVLWSADAARPGAIAALTVLGAVWALRSYRSTTSPLRPSVKRLLLGLRMAAVLLLGFVAIRPAIEYRRTRLVRGLVLVGLDASASMKRQDAPARAGSGMQSRTEAAADALFRAAGAIDDLGDMADMEWFTFSSSARPASAQPPWRSAEFVAASGAVTAVGDCAAAALNAVAASGREASAMLIISDGCNNTSDMIAPDTLAKQKGAGGLKIYAAGVGSEAIGKNTRLLNVRDLAAAEEVEAFNRLPISANIELVGLAGRIAKVTCTFGDQTVASETVVCEQDRLVKALRFVHVPLAAGFQRLTVRAQVEGEAAGLVGQMSATKLVHVVDRQMRVLYVEGRFGAEGKFLGQALVASQQFSINRLVLTKPLPPGGLGGLTDRLEDWLTYHAIIFRDVPASYFSPQQHEILRRLVGDYGKGFCMVGGRESFGAGGWQNTPVGAMMPVEMSASTGQVEGNVKVMPSREGLYSELMRIGPGGGDVAAAWAELGELDGANRLGGVKLGAQVLAQTGQNEPLIVAQTYGKGRSLAVAFDTTWRWVLTPKDTGEMQRRFWRQVALYLAAPKGNIWVTTDKSSYDYRRLTASPPELIKVTAGAEDAHGTPLANAGLNVTLTAPDGASVPIVLQPAVRREDGPGPNVMQAVLPTPKEPASPDGRDVYTLKIEAPGTKLGSATHQFEVVRQELESMDLLANHALLRAMADASGGAYAPIDRLGDLVKMITIATEPKPVAEIKRRDLPGDLRWPLVAGIISLLCLEWALRKRKGLV